MNDEVLIGAALLFAVSIVVRILPTFARINLSEERIDEIRNILPIAVLINLMLYCIVSEIHHGRMAALVGFGTLVFLTLLRRINLLLVVVLASVAYLVVR